jgi:hypothetical protein
MDFDQLEIFLEVARLSGFSRDLSFRKSHSRAAKAFMDTAVKQKNFSPSAAGTGKRSK